MSVNVGDGVVQQDNLHRSLLLLLHTTLLCLSLSFLLVEYNLSLEFSQRAMRRDTYRRGTTRRALPNTYHACILIVPLGITS